MICLFFGAKSDKPSRRFQRKLLKFYNTVNDLVGDGEKEKAEKDPLEEKK